MSSVETNPSLVKLKLLDCLRNGDSTKLDELVKICQNNSNPQLSKLKDQLLHYAVQVGPLSIIEHIVDNNLVDSINIQNEDENTPLHLAAMSSRAEVISFLMNQNSINDCIVNKDGHQPIESSSNMEIVQLLSDLRTRYVEVKANELRKSFESRDFRNLGKLLGNPRTKELLDINGTDPLTGDTVLLEFIKKNDLEMVRFILKNGGDPFKRNLNGKLPVDSASTPMMKKLIKDSCNLQTMIDAANLAGANQGAPTFKGFLKKWTNFANGYKLRWFILDAEGRLSYYKSPNDIYNTCRGMIHLSNAELRMDSSEKSKFEIILKNKNGGTPVKWHLKANHITETNRWVWALQNAIRFQKDLGKLPAPSQPQPQNQHRVRPSISENDQYRTFDTHMRSASMASNLSISSLDSVPSSEKTKTSLYKKPFKKVSKLARRSPNSTIDTSNPGLKYTNFASEQKRNASSASLAAPSVRDDQMSVLTKEEFYHDSEGEDDPYDEDEDEDEDEAEVDKEVEELMTNKKKPNVSQLIVIRNQLNMELNSFNEFLNNADDSISKEELIRVSQTILQNISTLIGKENDLMEKKRLKIDKVFERQHEISSIWENSIKQLELEIQDREAKICVLEDKVKILKKSIKRSIGEPAPISTRSTIVAVPEPAEKNKMTELPEDEEVTRILEEQDETDDEFFDAEESDGGIVVEPESATGTSVSAVVPELSIVKEERDDHIPESREVSGESTLATGEKAEKVDKVGVLKKSATVVNGFELNSKAQLSRYEKIAAESTFKGYEDPLRSTLAEEDNRPKVSLWGVLKSLVGKDMTKMTLPVSFNEPTSLLQRNTEVIEYSDLLDEAATIDDSSLRMVYVAAFAASEYVSTVGRIAKPFNPLLGETYEYARPDKGYRCFLEQVSHHPPISALVAEAPSWSYYGASHVKTKFLGRSFDIQHLGTWFCEIYPEHGVIDKSGKKKDMELYSWKKCNNSVVGIIIGNPTIDNYGEMEIKNHITGDYMNFHFKQRGWRASSAYEVKGEIYSKDGKLRYTVGGHWNSKIYAKKANDENAEKFLVWEANKRTDMMFHLTNFAASLNAPQPHLLPVLPCTDTRLRPDQRAMEDGDYDFAATEKNRLEEKQRAARKRLEDKQQLYRPEFFTKSSHPLTKDEYWKYNGRYWVDRKGGKLKNYRDIF